MTVIFINYDYSELFSLLNSLNCDFKKNEPLKNYTTFKTGGACPVLITPKTVSELSEILKYFSKKSLPYTVLGNGSNVLVPDRGVNCAVIRIANGLTTLSLSDETTVFCGAGVKLSTLCKFALENSLSGLEFAYGIPGTCGGALFMNGGAYGGEMKDVTLSVCHINKEGDEGSLSDDDLKFSYRHSAYEENGFIITGAYFKLKKAPKEEIKAKMDDLISRRREKQPLEYPSAGSTFKRPVGYFAGGLIEQCGLKGFSFGGAKVSEKHAGFVINYNNATSDDIKMLMELVKLEVFRKTGITLEPEVRSL